MLKWELWNRDPDSWDNTLINFYDYSVYQSYAWGEHRRNFGWEPYRLVAINNQQVVAMAQVLVRKYPLGITLAWVPGGPVGRLESWGYAFINALKTILNIRWIYCRISPVRKRDLPDIFNMSSSGWKRPIATLHSSMSLYYEPLFDESLRKMKASQSWRHNLKRSYRPKYGNMANLWVNPDSDEILSVYESMWNHKQIKGHLNKTELDSIIKKFGNNCLVVRCTDKNNKLIAIRGALLFGERAWDIFAAATHDARKVYATHLTFWNLINECQKRNIKWYDMGGVDPDGGVGVFNFKRGTGATELAYLGEWDRASSILLRVIINIIIKYKMRGL